MRFFISVTDQPNLNQRVSQTANASARNLRPPRPNRVSPVDPVGLTNQESLRLQYALQHRAREFGWHEADIDVIDSDLGVRRLIIGKGSRIWSPG